MLLAIVARARLKKRIRPRYDECIWLLQGDDDHSLPSVACSAHTSVTISAEQVTNVAIIDAIKSPKPRTRCDCFFFSLSLTDGALYFLSSFPSFLIISLRHSATWLPMCTVFLRGWSPSCTGCSPTVPATLFSTARTKCLTKSPSSKSPLIHSTISLSLSPPLPPPPPRPFLQPFLPPFSSHMPVPLSPTIISIERKDSFVWRLRTSFFHSHLYPFPRRGLVASLAPLPPALPNGTSTQDIIFNVRILWVSKDGLCQVATLVRCYALAIRLAIRLATRLRLDIFPLIHYMNGDQELYDGTKTQQGPFEDWMHME